MTKRDAPRTPFGKGLLPFGSAVFRKSRFALYSASPIAFILAADHADKTDFDDPPCLGRKSRGGTTQNRGRTQVDRRRKIQPGDVDLLATCDDEKKIDQLVITLPPLSSR